ncbi:MAG: DUF4330 family protein [Clostridia bacterium]|nr:DUF4330 family protein [Clostridia bacterium]
MKWNKKTFNALDALIIVAFVAIFVFLGVKTLSEAGWRTEKVQVIVIADCVPNDIIAQINEGDMLYNTDGTFIGVVKKSYTAKATQVYADTRVDSGNRWPLVTVEVPDHSRIVMTVEIDAESDSRGYSVNGVNLKVNGDIEFYINGFSADGYFAGITGVKSDEE